MLYQVYIIYSKSRNRYYIGSTGDNLTDRIRRHNSVHKGFTANTTDWKLVYTENFDTKIGAQKRERQIIPNCFQDFEKILKAKFGDADRLSISFY